jgi:hypothetical protein
VRQYTNKQGETVTVKWCEKKNKGKQCGWNKSHLTKDHQTPEQLAAKRAAAAAAASASATTEATNTTTSSPSASVAAGMVSTPTEANVAGENTQGAGDP